MPCIATWVPKTPPHPQFCLSARCLSRRGINSTGHNETLLKRLQRRELVPLPRQAVLVVDVVLLFLPRLRLSSPPPPLGPAQLGSPCSFWLQLLPQLLPQLGLLLLPCSLGSRALRSVGELYWV